MFDLVPESGTLDFDAVSWQKVQYNLLEFQPAKKVRLVDGSPPRIRVYAYGSDAEVAPGIMRRLEELAGTSLRVEVLEVNRRWWRRASGQR